MLSCLLQKTHSFMYFTKYINKLINIYSNLLEFTANLRLKVYCFLFIPVINLRIISLATAQYLFFCLRAYDASINVKEIVAKVKKLTGFNSQNCMYVVYLHLENENY